MDNSIVYDYYSLPSRIKRAQERLKDFESTFWEQSFMNCPLSFDDNGNSVHPKPFDKQIDDLIAYEEFNDTVIDLLRFKLDHFKRYLDSLSEHEQKSLNAHFSHNKSIPLNPNLEQTTINECKQIEEASGYRYGFSTDKAIEVTDDYKSNFDSILSILN